MKLKINNYFKKHPVFLTLFGAYFITVVLLTLSGLIFYYFKSPVAFILIAFLIFLASYLGPIWFRIFLKARSYQGKYREKLLAYSQELHCDIKDVYIKKSDSLNACAFSFGNNKTICFNSAVFERCSWDEIKAVMTHEIGHHVNRDIYLYSTLVVIMMAVFSGFGIFILVVSVILVPIEIGISRWREREADEFTKRMLGDARGLAQFLKKVIADANRDGVTIPLNPSMVRRLSSIHPGIYERIRILEEK